MTADITHLKAATKSVLSEIGRQAKALADGLQHAAPPQEGKQPATSVQYLLEISLQLSHISTGIEVDLPVDSTMRQRGV